MFKSTINNNKIRLIEHGDRIALHKYWFESRKKHITEIEQIESRTAKMNQLVTEQSLQIGITLGNSVDRREIRKNYNLSSNKDDG